MNKTKYVKIPRDLLEDNRISARAKIVMCILIALGSDSKPYFDEIVAMTGFSKCTVYRAITELRETSYCEINENQTHITFKD